MPINSMLWEHGNKRWKNVVTGAIITPTPPSNTFEFTVMPGGNDARGWTKNQSYDALITALGRNLNGRIKFFSGNTIANAVVNRTVDTSHSIEPYPIYCFKSWDLNQFNSFMDTLNHVCAVCYEHEFYTTIQSEWDAYNAVYAAMKAARDAHVNGHYIELQAMSAMSKHRNNPGYFTKANPANFDSWGADTYNAKGTTPYTAGQCFDDQYAAWTTMKTINPNLKWRVAEYGLSRLVVGGGALWTGAERIAFIEGHISYAKSLGCSSIGFWGVDNTNDAPIKDWSIDKGTPADVATAAYMANLMNTYPVQGV